MEGGHSANLMTLALACGGGGVTNRGFFSEVCGDDSDPWLCRLDAGEEPPDGPYGQLPSNNILIWYRLFIVWGTTQRRAVIDWGASEPFIASNLSISSSLMLVWGVIISQIHRTKVSWCPRVPVPVDLYYYHTTIISLSIILICNKKEL